MRPPPFNLGTRRVLRAFPSFFRLLVDDEASGEVRFIGITGRVLTGVLVRVGSKCDSRGADFWSDIAYGRCRVLESNLTCGSAAQSVIFSTISLWPPSQLTWIYALASSYSIILRRFEFEALKKQKAWIRHVCREWLEFVNRKAPSASTYRRPTWMLYQTDFSLVDRDCFWGHSWRSARQSKQRLKSRGCGRSWDAWPKASTACSGMIASFAGARTQRAETLSVCFYSIYSSVYPADSN